MRALILNGALAGDTGLAPVEESIDAALSRRGWSVDRVRLRDLMIAYCQGCFECWVKTPGVCKTNDSARGVTSAIARSDLLVLLSPVTFGGYSSEIKKALDRSIGLVSPLFIRVGGEVHHKARYARYPALLGVGVMDQTDQEEERIFRTLVSRNAINVHAPAHLATIVHRSDTQEQIGRTVGRAVAQIESLQSGAA